MKTIVTSPHIRWNHGDCAGLALVFGTRVYHHPVHQDQVTLEGRISSEQIRRVVGEPVQVKYANSRKHR